MKLFYQVLEEYEKNNPDALFLRAKSFVNISKKEYALKDLHIVDISS